MAHKRLPTPNGKCRTNTKLARKSAFAAADNSTAPVEQVANDHPNGTATAHSMIPTPRKLPAPLAQNTNAEQNLKRLDGNESSGPIQGASHSSAVDKKAREQRLHELIMSACKVTGISSREMANRIVIQVAAALVPEPKDGEDELISAICAIAEMEPHNLTEAMLATQMLAANDAALMFLSRATIENQHPEAIDTNVLRATRLMRLFGEQLQAMQKLKGKSGQQKVTVEHVHVHDGGQAIVGTVAAGGTGRGVGDDTENQ